MANETLESFAQEETQRLIHEMVSIRKESYLSQKELSELMGLSSHGNITLIEQGKSSPRLDRFLKILGAMGYTLEIKKK